jgi:hypothetical protein
MITIYESLSQSARARSMSHTLYQLAPLVTLLAALTVAADESRYSFDNDEEGALPTGWVATKTGDGPGSIWKIVADDSDGKRGRVLAQTSAEGANALFNLCVLKDLRAADVDLSVRVKAVGGAHDRGGGLVWRFRDANNYYVTRWNPLEDNFRVYHVVGGKRTQLATADIKLPSTEWHSVRALHRGNQIRCYLDGSLLLEVTDDTLQGSGAVGLWSKADAVTWFDDLSVNILAKE